MFAENKNNTQVSVAAIKMNLTRNQWHRVGFLDLRIIEKVAITADFFLFHWHSSKTYLWIFLLKSFENI